MKNRGFSIPVIILAVGALLLSGASVLYTTSKNNIEVFGSGVRYWVYNRSKKLVRSLNTTQGTLISNTGATATTSSVALEVIGGLKVDKATTSSFAISGLVNCNTIDTDANGTLICGTDETGAGGGTGAAWEIYNTDTTALTPTNTSAGIFVQASSTIAANATTTGNFTANDTLYVKDGNVGIGTQSPLATLQLGPFNSNHLLLTSSNNNFGWLIDTIDQGSGNVPLRIFRRTGGGYVQVVTIKNQDGRFGISTSTPFAHLSVEGQGTYPSFVISDTLNNTNLIVDKSGNLGLGTVNPQAQLHLTQDARIPVVNATTTVTDTLRIGTDNITDITGTGLQVSAGSLQVTLSPFTTDNLSEGTSNLYYTDTRVANYIVSSSTVPNVGGCASGEVLKWDGSAFVCSTDNTGASAGAAWEKYTTGYITPTTSNVGVFVTSTSTFSAIRIATTSKATAKLEITDTSGSMGSAYGMLRIISYDSSGGNYEIRMDSPNPDIEFIESDQVSPAGKFEIAVQSDVLQINGRNAADSSFENAFNFLRPADGGGMSIGNDNSPDARLEILQNGTMDFLNLSSSSPADGDIMTIDYQGNIITSGGVNMNSATITDSFVLGADTIKDITGTGLQITANALQVTLSPFTTSDLAEGSNLYYTDERVDDRVAVLIQDGTGLTWTYNDTANTLTGNVSLTPFTTDNLSEGSTNLYYTDTRVANYINASNTIITTDDINTEADLESILTDVTNVYTNNDGNLTDDDLSDNNTDQLAEGSTNLYYTDARVASYISSSSTVPNIGGCSSGQVIKWDGTNFVCGTDNTGSGGTGAAWEAFSANVITPTTTGAAILVNNASSTITNLNLNKATATKIAISSNGIVDESGFSGGVFGDGDLYVASEGYFEEGFTMAQGAGIGFDSDLNTIIYAPANDTLSFLTNMQKRVEITNSMLQLYPSVSLLVNSSTSTITNLWSDTVNATTTNVTNLTIGGNTFTNLAGTGLQVTSGVLETTLGTSVDLTTEVTGTLPVANGGTGATTFTANGVLYGNGTSALQVTSAPTAGQILIGNSSGVPTFVAMSGDVTIDSSGVTSIGADKITEAMLKAVDTPTDEECLTYEATVGDFEWQSCGTGGSSTWTDNGTWLTPAGGEGIVVNSSSTIAATSTILYKLQMGTSQAYSWDNILTIKPERTYSSSRSQGGAVNIYNTNNDREALVIYASTTSANAALLRLENESWGRTSGMLRINSRATGGADYDIRIDSPNPDIEFVDTSETAPAGRFEFASNGDYFQFTGRNAADTAFESIMVLERIADGGRVGINDTSPDAMLDIVYTTGNDLLYLSSGSTGNGDILAVTNNGVLSVGGWKYPDGSTGKIQLNSNAVAPSTIDLSNTIAVGATSANATNKYLGQFGWVSRDASFTAPKLVAYIGAEATETYAADTDTGSAIVFYTGTNNSSNPTEKLRIDQNGDLIFSGGGISNPSYIEAPNGTAPVTDSVGEIAVDTTSGQFQYNDGTAERAISYLIEKTMTIPTSTLAYVGTATTTVPIGVAMQAQTWVDISCYTDAGTATIAFNDGTNYMDYITCGTAVTSDDGSIANNTFTALEKRYVDIGNVSATTNWITISVNYYVNPD